MKPSFEQLNENNETLSGKEKFDVVLNLFGSEAAKNAFLEACKKYVTERKTSSNIGHDEIYVPRTRRTYSPPKRAALHNQIMETLKRLSLQKLDPLSEKVLFEMADREIAGGIIEDWVRANEGEEDEDEIERKKGKSTTTYYHSKGED